MTLSLQIIEPVNGTGFTSEAQIHLVGRLTGDPSGLFFKWFSSLNMAMSAAHPEINKGDHSAAILNWREVPLKEFGTHVIVLAATDQEHNDRASLLAVTCAALAGGAPPATPPRVPCVIHRVVAQFRTPAADEQALSKSSTTLEFLAPDGWAKNVSGTWEPDTDYQQINGITMALRFTPVGVPDPDHSADIPLVLTSLPFFRDGDRTWFRWTGSLPANLKTSQIISAGTGTDTEGQTVPYTLTLIVKGGGATHTDARRVLLVP